MPAGGSALDGSVVDGPPWAAEAWLRAEERNSLRGSSSLFSFLWVESHLDLLVGSGRAGGEGDGGREGVRGG